MKPTITESLLVSNHEVLKEFTEWYASTAILSEEEIDTTFSQEDTKLIDSFEGLYNLLCCSQVEYLYSVDDQAIIDELDGESNGMCSMVKTLAEHLYEHHIEFSDSAPEFDEVKDVLLQINAKSDDELVKHMQDMSNNHEDVEKLLTAIQNLQNDEANHNAEHEQEQVKAQPTFEGIDALLKSINTTMTIINEKQLRANIDKVYEIIRTNKNKETVIAEVTSQSSGSAVREFLEKNVATIDYDTKQISAKVKQS